jgi:hypothetical protein
MSGISTHTRPGRSYEETAGLFDIAFVGNSGLEPRREVLRTPELLTRE